MSLNVLCKLKSGTYLILGHCIHYSCAQKLFCVTTYYYMLFVVVFCLQTKQPQALFSIKAFIFVFNIFYIERSQSTYEHLCKKYSKDDV